MKLIQGKYLLSKERTQQLLGDRFFEFSLAYCDKHSQFRELDRFLFESRHFLRFAKEYSGGVLIDLSEWNHREPNSYLKAFIYFLADNGDKYDTVLIVNDKCSEKLKELLSEIIELEIETTVLPEKSKRSVIGFRASESEGQKEEKNNV